MEEKNIPGVETPNFEMYIGTKIIGGFPMNLGDYNKYRGWQLPADEYPKTEGYIVQYSDGYISWSPKEQFEKAYRKIKTGEMSFGLAIEALKLGKLISRKGWNKSDQVIMKQIPAEIGLDIIPNMQSLQQSLKNRLLRNETTIKYTNQMLIVQPDGKADSWVPSSSDIFSDDWFIVE